MSAGICLWLIVLAMAALCGALAVYFVNQDPEFLSEFGIDLSAFASFRSPPRN